MKTLILFTILAFTAIGHAMPKKIILIRHGEEPKGVEGRELSNRGWERANGLPQLFSKEKITHLIALKPHKKKGSIRSIQTLGPIAETLNLEIQSPYTRDEVQELVQMLSHDSEYQDKVVLVAWQSETLAELAQSFSAELAPAKWGNNVFDRYWVLEFKNGTVINFKNLPQRLLAKDSVK